MQDPPKEQPPGNSQVKELSHVSALESGTAVPTDGESRQMVRRYGVVAFLNEPYYGLLANLSGYATEGLIPKSGIELLLT